MHWNYLSCPTKSATSFYPDFYSIDFEKKTYQMKQTPYHHIII